MDDREWRQLSRELFDATLRVDLSADLNRRETLRKLRRSKVLIAELLRQIKERDEALLDVRNRINISLIRLYNIPIVRDP